MRRLILSVVFVVLLWSVVVEVELFGSGISSYGRQALNHGRRILNGIAMSVANGIIRPTEIAVQTTGIKKPEIVLTPVASITAAMRSPQMP